MSQIIKGNLPCHTYNKNISLSKLNLMISMQYQSLKKETFKILFYLVIFLFLKGLSLFFFIKSMSDSNSLEI